jgi:prolyl-tRNA editing enzyme YbaK/EbsC (Cys-tRNA(Pro) deacylase)
MNQAVNQALHQWLREQGISYRVVTHAPTRTSEESALARGEDLRVGGKALVLKTDEEFRLFVLSAALRIDSAAIKRQFSAKKVRFASAGELEQLTGLVSGAVPPFGRPILPLDLFVDSMLPSNQVIAFNAGLLTESFILEMKDYLEIAKPTVFSLAKG